MDNLIDKVSRYREDIIPVFEFMPDNYLRFNRVKYLNSYKTDFYIDNDISGEATYLGFYYHGKWSFNGNYLSNIFWSLIKNKKRYKQVNDIMKRIGSFSYVPDNKIVRNLYWRNKRHSIKRWFNKIQQKLKK